MDDKGFDVAIDALPRVRERFPDTRLAIAGGGSARARLERRARSLRLAPAVEFLGEVEPEFVPALINAATLVLMPSRWEEAFGLVALQAAQMARPVVASRVGGIPEIVVHGENGFLVEKDNPPAFAEAIEYLLARPHEAGEMGKRGRARATARFGWDRYVDEHEALYRRLTQAVVKPPTARTKAVR